MIKDTLMEIGGVGLYGVVSILLFVTVFGLAMYRVFRLRRPFLQDMGALPLAEDHVATPVTTEACHE